MPVPAISPIAAPANPRSPFAGMVAHHVALRVSDYAAAKRWFVDKLDFRVAHEWPFGALELAYLAPANDEGFFIELIGGEAPAPKRAYADLGDSLHEAGYHHFCLTVASVDATVAELRRRGVTLVGEAFDFPPIQRRLAFFADPWGNLFELAEVLA